MARPLRLTYPPGYYHVYARGVDGCPIYRTRRDRLDFIDLLASAARVYRWDCWALCLMTNHYHLVLDVAQPWLSRGMQWLNGRYATGFNHRHGRTGHLFGGRFGAVAIEDERQLAHACEYVLANPVRAGLCETASAWPWSGYRRAA